VAYDMFNLAKALKAKSENVEAESLFRRSLEMQQKLLPPDHPDIARCQVGLGSFLEDTGRSEEAEPHLIAGLALWKKLEANPPYIVEAENALALTEATLGRSGDQERVLISSYQKLHDLEGERTSRTKDARQRVYRFYELRHQPDKAEQYRVMDRPR
jgi:tetratricopeptide (TPR) repeat protein